MRHALCAMRFPLPPAPCSLRLDHFQFSSLTPSFLIFVSSPVPLPLPLCAMRFALCASPLRLFCALRYEPCALRFPLLRAPSSVPLALYALRHALCGSLLRAKAPISL